MSARRRFLPGSLALALATLLFGCLREDPRADLVIINNVEPGSLDPATAIGIEEMRIVTALFEGLTRVDPVTARAIPGLAERWSTSPDGRTYTFFLRPKARWSTGEPIRAADVLYSWFRVLDKSTASDYAGQLFYLKNAEAFYNGKCDRKEVGLRALDDDTIEVQLINPTAYFLDLCALPVLAVVPRHVIERLGDRWLRARPLSVNGPYQLEDWRVNTKVRLRKNPRYWDAAQTRSELVDLLPISNPSAAFNLYQAREADIIWDKDVVPAELLEVLRTAPDYHSFTYLGTYFLRINVTRKPFDDLRVRQALALVIDKERIVRNLRKSGEPVANHLVPPGTLNAKPPSGLPYDPERARRLLKQAGYPGGQGFPAFEYFFDSAGGGASLIHGQIGVELQQMWQRGLGLKVGLRRMEKKVFLRAQSALQYDVSRSSWIGDYNDPTTFLDLFLSNNGNNRTGWKNPSYDHFLQQASTQTDLDTRATLLQQAETLLVRDEVPLIPLFFYNGFNYYNPDRIQGIHTNILDLHPLGAIWKVASR
ncbi:MAG TPA: peptide ABC transporter substrate-binding protein [Candidatus Dormibacteraeota bacterium]|nr:peptide ABC transporter substrate-binding protein [Candidatus Dormibacteraeota bacterium]